MNPKIRLLRNGVKVANFSSPHSFTFDDGTILDAVSDKTSTMLKIDFNEKLMILETGQSFDTIMLTFGLSNVVKDKIRLWVEKYIKGDVDVVLVPLPMITAMRQSGEWDNDKLLLSPFRSIRIEDRTKKVISSKKFCI